MTDNDRGRESHLQRPLSAGPDAAIEQPSHSHPTPDRTVQEQPVPTDDPPARHGHATSRMMYGIMLVWWVGIIVFSLPLSYAMLTASAGVIPLLVRAIVVIALPIFWLFGMYNIVVTLFGYVFPDSPDRVSSETFAEQSVAIVYPTFNDFSADHLRQSMHQWHEQTHTYIVDDSTEPDIIAAIDWFASLHDDVTVVRRDGREGYKAGAINHAIATVIDEPFIALMDADEVLPPNFITETLTYFADDGVGFVQGNHDYNRETATRFGRALGIGVDIHWDIYQSPRNAYGFVMLLGHGALIRRDVIEEIGGFPELVSEDLAFATRAREYGYRGVFASTVTCLEDFPVDYAAFRQRHKKWTAGSIEYIAQELPRFLTARTIPLVEKLDVLVPTLQLPLTVVFLAYLVAVGMLSVLGMPVVPPSTPVPIVLGVVTVATLLSPVYCYIIGLTDRPKKLLHFIALSTTIYCSVAITAVAHGAKVLLPWEGAEFLTTPKEASGVALRSYALTVGAGVATFALATQSGLLIGAAASTWVVAPLIAYYNGKGLAGQVARTVSLLPIVMLLVGIVSGVLIIF